MGVPSLVTDSSQLLHYSLALPLEVEGGGKKFIQMSWLLCMLKVKMKDFVQEFNILGQSALLVLRAPLTTLSLLSISLCIRSLPYGN